MSITDNIKAIKSLSLTQLESLTKTLQFHLHSGDVTKLGKVIEKTANNESTSDLVPTQEDINNLKQSVSQDIAKLERKINGITVEIINISPTFTDPETDGVVSTTTPNLEVKYTITFKDPLGTTNLSEIYLKAEDITVTGGTLKQNSFKIIAEKEMELVIIVNNNYESDKTDPLDGLKIEIGPNTEIDIKGQIVSAIIDVDTKKPRVTSIVSDFTGIISDTTNPVIKYTVTFSEEMKALDNTNISVIGGQLISTEPIRMSTDKNVAEISVQANDNSVESLVLKILDTAVDKYGNTLALDNIATSTPINVDTSNPVISGPTNNEISIAENTTVVYQFTASDQPAISETNVITWSVLDNTSDITDGSKFTIDENGNLSFIDAPDYEAPNSVHTTDKNRYTVIVRATDGALNVSDKQIVVMVTNDTADDQQPEPEPDVVGIIKKPDVIVIIDGDNVKPTINGPQTIDVDEKTKEVYTFTATDTPPVSNDNVITWSIKDSPTESEFEIDSVSGSLSFKTAPDFDSSSDLENTYVVTITAKDNAGNISEHTLQVNVLEDDDLGDDTIGIIYGYGIDLDDDEDVVGVIDHVDPDVQDSTQTNYQQYRIIFEGKFDAGVSFTLVVDGHQHGAFQLTTYVIMPYEDDEDSEYYNVYPDEVAESFIDVFINYFHEVGEDDFFVEASAEDDGEDLGQSVVLLTSNRPGSFDLSIVSNLSEPEKEGKITIALCRGGGCEPTHIQTWP